MTGDDRGSLSHASLAESLEWLSRAGDASRRTFLCGLLVRCGSVAVLRQVRDVLRVTADKDFTYARSKRPSFAEDAGTCGSDRALDAGRLDGDMRDTWERFRCSQDGVKADYLLSVLGLCNSELLRMLRNLAHVLLERERASVPWKEHSQSHEPFAVQTNEGFVCEDLLESGGEDEDSETDMAESGNPALMVEPESSASMCGVSQHRDFVRCLPVHLAKRILGILDKCSLQCCLRVSFHWRYLAEDTLADISAKSAIEKKALKMQSNRNRVSDVYANIVGVLVPASGDEEGDSLTDIKKDKAFEAAYAGVRTKVVQMEERNVYCGVYNVTVLLEKEDPYRVVSYSGGQLLALGSRDRMVHLLCVRWKREAAPALRGHAGSVRALLLLEDRGLVVSAGYDLTIRCWDLKTKACVTLLRGHTGTITCLDSHGDRLVSGAKDRKVKVWSLQTGKCFEDLKFKHSSSVQCVKMDACLVYSSCDKGQIKIWDIQTAALSRVIEGHRSSVRCLCFDRWHLVSGDVAGQVMVWSTNWEVKEHLVTFSHPKEVRCLTLLYLRVISGCADGRIRIFNLLTGDCLRVITAVGKQSPVISLFCHDNSVLVNTTSSVQLYQFARVQWEYKGGPEGQVCSSSATEARPVTQTSPCPPRTVPHSFARAERMVLIGSTNPKVYHGGSGTAETAGLSHHAGCLSAHSLTRAQVSQRRSLRPATWTELLTYRRSTAYIDLQPEFITRSPSAIHPGRPVSRLGPDAQRTSTCHTSPDVTRTRRTVTHTPATSRTPESTADTPKQPIHTPTSPYAVGSPTSIPKGTGVTARGTFQNPRTWSSWSSASCSVRDVLGPSEVSAALGEKAGLERVKGRGLSRPLSTGRIPVRVGCVQQWQRMEEAAIDMGLSSSLLDTRHDPPCGSLQPHCLDHRPPWASRQSTQAWGTPPDHRPANRTAATARLTKHAWDRGDAHSTAAGAPPALPEADRRPLQAGGWKTWAFRVEPRYPETGKDPKRRTVTFEMPRRSPAGQAAAPTMDVGGFRRLAESPVKARLRAQSWGGQGSQCRETSEEREWKMAAVDCTRKGKAFAHQLGQRVCM